MFMTTEVLFVLSFLMLSGLTYACMEARNRPEWKGLLIPWLQHERVLVWIVAMWMTYLFLWLGVMLVNTVGLGATATIFGFLAVVSIIVGCLVLSGWYLWRLLVQGQ